MAGHGEKFGRKKEDAIAALLSQRNIDEAAEVTGIGARTLLRWLKDPEFDTAYRKARRLAFGQAIARLQQASSAAVSTLLKTMVDATAPHSTRVRAADSVLAHAANAIEIEDVEVRVSEIERNLEASRQGTAQGSGRAAESTFFDGSKSWNRARWTAAVWFRTPRNGWRSGRTSSTFTARGSRTCN